MMKERSKLRAGDWVEVRNKKEILETLDQRGQLEGLPFMPEMFQFCGQQFRVFKRAHKTCDPPNGLGGRRMVNTVHLERIRCDGKAHGGCQAACLIFWKEAWLKRLNPVSRSSFELAVLSQPAAIKGETGRCAEHNVWAGTRAPEKMNGSEEPVYACQSTELARATERLRWWDVRQYVEDFTSGNVRFSQMLVAILLFIYHQIATAGLGLGSALRWAYDCFQKMRRGTPYPWRIGEIPRGAPTPSARLNLQPGELVKVKSYPEILQTLTEDSRNRGLSFDAEMVPFCNETFRILKRVEQIIDEKSGKMFTFKNDAVILENVVCEARYARCRRFCPRSIYPYWREIWLERVGDGQNPSSKVEAPKRC